MNTLENNDLFVTVIKSTCLCISCHRPTLFMLHVFNVIHLFPTFFLILIATSHCSRFYTNYQRALLRFSNLVFVETESVFEDFIKYLIKIYDEKIIKIHLMILLQTKKI